MRITGVAVVAAAVVLVAGCGGGGDAGPTLPPVTAPATTSAVPTPSVSAFPDTPQGAAAFARFALEAIDRAYASRDEAELRVIFDSTCSACKNFLTSIAQIRDQNLRVQGGTSKILSAETPGGQGELVSVDTRSQYDGLILTRGDGTEVLREAPGELQTTVVLRRVDDEWRVARLVNVR